jgi:hypothetical protein
MYLRKIGLEDVDSVHLDQDMDWWRALVNNVPCSYVVSWFVVRYLYFVTILGTREHC